MKSKKQLEDLEKAKAHQELSQNQGQTEQPVPQPAPLDQLQQQLDGLAQTLRQQRAETEAGLQDAFSQATAGLGDAQALAQLQQVVSSLTGLARNQGLQGSAAQYHQLLGRLEQDLQKQVQSGLQQAARSLQQGVSALAQATAALIDNQIYCQLIHQVCHSRRLLTNWEFTGDTRIH